MLEFAMPNNTSGQWRVTVIGNVNTGGGTDSTGEPINPYPMPDGHQPQLTLAIGPAGNAANAFMGAGESVNAEPVPGTGAFAVHVNVTAEKAAQSSLYIHFNEAPFGQPYALSIYDVTAEPLDPGISTKRGGRRAYFS